MRASGTPRAATLNSRRNIQLLRTEALVSATVVLTAACETFTCEPAVKPGFVATLRKVSTARPIAHRQKRRMPRSMSYAVATR